MKESYTMKKNPIFSKLIISSLILVMSFTFFSCNEKDKTSGKIVHPINVTMSIDFPNKSKIPDVIEAHFAIEEGASVLDMIQLYCTVNNMPLTVETTSTYIQGIDGVMEGDYGKREWQFKINDVLCDADESEQIVENNDHVSWVFKKATNK